MTTDAATSLTVTITINGRRVSRTVEPRLLLVHLLREQVGLTGTHVGCDTSNCGACTVLFDGEAVKSCTVLAAMADGHTIRTVEGLEANGRLDPVQQGFMAEHGLQCGFCTPGMLMATTSLLADDPDPDEAAIRTALEGNLCRCTGYQMIVNAVRWAAERGGATVAGEPLARTETHTAVEVTR
ncbi:MAG: (2Fe-2S)-binding protein [Acidimicrobiales bacterium]|nr:(2Fe-2S)-binding protein [Acidimicrobiales bacterium]